MSNFLDSNIVLYSLGDDEAKRTIAQSLLETRPWISTQVISECSHVLRRKQAMKPSGVAAILETLLLAVRYIEVNLVDVRQAWSLAQRYGFSHYDSLIVATALKARCTTLYTEDLQHDQLIDGQLRLCNPFQAPIRNR